MKKFLKLGQKDLAWAYFLMLIGWLAAGCALSKPHTLSPLPVDLFETESAGPTVDLSMVGDMVIVKFPVPSSPVPPHEEQIKEDGTITLPLIGALKADGKTARELETGIQDRYAPLYYKRLSVAVAIGRGSYFVSGQVRRPGLHHYVGPTTVTKAIESAGGLTEFTKGRRVRLTRVDGRAFIVNCAKAAKDTSLDLPVYPGDKIDVPQEGPPMDIFR